MCDAEHATGTRRLSTCPFLGTIAPYEILYRGFQANLHVALVLDIPLLGHVARSVVGIERVGAHSDRARRHARVLAVVRVMTYSPFRRRPSRIYRVYGQWPVEANSSLDSPNFAIALRVFRAARGSF